MALESPNDVDPVNPWVCSKFLSNPWYQIIWGPFGNVLVSNQCQLWLDWTYIFFIPGDKIKTWNESIFRVYLVYFSKGIFILIFRCTVHWYWLTFSAHSLRAEILGRDALSLPSKSKHKDVCTFTTHTQVHCLLDVSSLLYICKLNLQHMYIKSIGTEVCSALSLHVAGSVLILAWKLC